MTITFYTQREEKLDPRHSAFQFPGGEAHIVLDPPDDELSTEIAFVRGADGNDLFKLAMWSDACDRNGVLSKLLVLPYLPGARQDRGRPLGAKVYADFINGLGIDDVVTIDPHSDVAPALYDRLTVVSLTDLPFWASNHDRWDGVIIPDVGAVKRATAVADRLGVPTFQASKKRDFKTGALSGFVAPEGLREDGGYLVVDDICDGGGTFNGLAQAIVEKTDEGRSLGETWSTPGLDLWVTHGIFSKGLHELLGKHYTNIFTTNSHPGSAQNVATNTFDILPTLIKHVKGL